jgi:hypothetical protein
VRNSGVSSKHSGYVWLFRRTSEMFVSFRDICFLSDILVALRVMVCFLFFELVTVHHVVDSYPIRKKENVFSFMFLCFLWLDVGNAGNGSYCLSQSLSVLSVVTGFYSVLGGF